MNERLIEQLAEQAGMMRDKFGLYWNAHDNPDDGVDLELFAQLIVRECARIVPNTDLDDVDGGDSAVLRAASQQIRKHFGVE